MELMPLVSRVFECASFQQRKDIAEELQEQSSEQISKLICDLYNRLWLADFAGKPDLWLNISVAYESLTTPNLSATTKAWIESLSLDQCKIFAQGLAGLFGIEKDVEHD